MPHDPLAIFESSIEDQIKVYGEVTRAYLVIHNGQARLLPHHEVYDLVILALDILNEPDSCQAIVNAREDQKLNAYLEQVEQEFSYA